MNLLSRTRGHTGATGDIPLTLLDTQSFLWSSSLSSSFTTPSSATTRDALSSLGKHAIAMYCTRLDHIKSLAIPNPPSYPWWGLLLNILCSFGASLSGAESSKWLGKILSNVSCWHLCQAPSVVWAFLREDLTLPSRSTNHQVDHPFSKLSALWHNLCHRLLENPQL